MKKWIIRCLILFVPIMALVALTNYFVDPANIYHASMTDYIIDGLKDYEAVEIVGDFDEGKLLEKKIASMDKTAPVMVMGSSHVLYVDWQFDEYENIGMSGEFLDDYYATVGLLDKYDRLPETLIIGVDPYIFMDGLGIRQESLNSYAADAKAMISGNKRKGGFFENGELKKFKELFSFSYFQSSVQAKINGINASYVNGVNDTGEGEYPKILANGKRIPAVYSYNSVIDMDNAADWDISVGAVYCMTDFEELSSKQTGEWEALLDYLISKNVEVVLYLPCWYPNYYNEFVTNDKFGGVIKAEEYLKAEAFKRGIRVCGSYNPEACGIVKEDYMDHFHLNPKGGLKNFEAQIN